MQTPHDALFCHVFADPRHAAAELRALLPTEVEQLVAWDTLERLPDSDKDVRRGDRYADLLFGVEIGGRRALLYLLLEHKSQPERFAVLQLLGYVVRVLERHRREHPDEQRLPPIVVLLVHHGPDGWRRAIDLRELFDLDGVTGPVLEPYLPQLRVLLDDLARVDAGELARRALTAVAHLTLACLRRISGDATVAQVFRELGGLFRAARSSADGADLCAAVLTYVAKVRDLTRDEFQGLVRAELGPEVEDLMTSTYDQVLNEGRRLGLAEGKAEGKAETLFALLVKRFGEPAPELVARVRSASGDALDRWLLRLLDAARIEDVFADR